jgi:hypothetical protein
MGPTQDDDEQDEGRLQHATSVEINLIPTLGSSLPPHGVDHAVTGVQGHQEIGPQPDRVVRAILREINAQDRNVIVERRHFGTDRRQ